MIATAADLHGLPGTRAQATSADDEFDELARLENTEEDGSDEEDEDDDAGELLRAAASIDAIALSKSKAPARPTAPVISAELRRSSDKVDWDALTPLALEVVESALKPRKQEWLVIDSKPVPGAKHEVYDGPWFTGDAKLGWAALPDTEDMPRMVDGSMLEWANVNTKLPNQEGYLDVRPMRRLRPVRLSRPPPG